MSEDSQGPTLIIVRAFIYRVKEKDEFAYYRNSEGFTMYVSFTIIYLIYMPNYKQA